MRAYERLLRYVQIHTESDPESEDHPTSSRQFDLARLLARELTELGVKNVSVDEHCLVYGFIDATPGKEELPRIGFLAHMDTAPDFPGAGVKPQIHENYDGGVLPIGCGRALDPAVFPHLKNLVGRTLITTDGSTLLGADDKAGIAEILTMLERLRAENIPHGPLAVCFTPDEEVGKGTDCVDLEHFGCAYAYTVDGGPEGEVVFENFNAASAEVCIKGVNVHPGSAYGVMVNAATLAARFIAMLPPEEVPEKTRGYEGFFHLTDLLGSVEEAKLSFLIRDHDRARFEERKQTIYYLTDKLNRSCGGTYATATVQDSYYNMKEKIMPVYDTVVRRALDATRAAGIEPRIEPIRGGTDGARLSYLGLPTPNLGTGGYAYHGPFEHITVEGMDRAVEILLRIAQAE